MAFKISIGCDPELAVRDRKTGEFISAHNLIPGTKNEPHKVSDANGEFGAVQVDGVAAEFNTMPQFTAQGFSDNISKVIGSLKSFVGEKYELVSLPAVHFKEDYFKSLPDHVKELGCNPDYDAYTGQITEKPDGAATLMRTFSGHIHIGGWYNGDPTSEIHQDDCRIVAKNLDIYLGLYSLQWDPDKDRRKLYGKAGCYRPKPYGIEYRPMSNVWLRTPQLQQWVFNASVKCMTNLMTQGTRADETFGEIAKDFINNSESWWTPEDAKKSKDHSKLYNTMAQVTGLKAPPPLPKANPVLDAKVADKANPKFKYRNKNEVLSAHVKGEIASQEAVVILNQMTIAGIGYEA